MYFLPCYGKNASIYFGKMTQMNVKKTCNATIQQHIDRMHTLCEEERVQDAKSVYEEIRDWVIQKENIEVLSLGYINEFIEDFE